MLDAEYSKLPRLREPKQTHTEETYMATNAPSRKGLPGAKSFTSYKGNVKSSGTKVPAGTRKTPSGGKVKGNANDKKMPKQTKKFKA